MVIEKFCENDKKECSIFVIIKKEHKVIIKRI